MLEGDLQRRGDAVEVRREQLHLEVPRRVVRRPRHAGLLVGAEQHAALLLADVDLAGEVEGHRHLPAGALVVLLHLGHRLGDHVHVLHGQHGQLDADHAADLARPQPAGVDDVLGVDLALVGDDVPRPVGTLAEVGDHGVPVDLGPGVAGADGVGVGDAGRVDVALDRVEQRAHEVLVLHEREDGLGLGGGDDLQVHAQVPAPGLGHAQPVQPLAGVGQHRPPGRWIEQSWPEAASISW